MKFKRSDVVKALMTEPLAQRNFVDESNIVDDKCAVCAVGAVLRQAGFSDEEINSAAIVVTGGMDADASISGSVSKALKSKDYLLALSCKFEQIEGDINLTERKKLVSWVKKTFPKEFRG